MTTLITPLLLPLENGDKLTRHEFERRYNAMPHHQKAELIKGVVYMASPLRMKSHGKPHAHIITWLGIYETATPGVEVGDNATVRLDLDNEPQPDALLRIEKGGQSRITEDDYVEGAPELIVEVAASSASIDLHDKLEAYKRNQVQEYIVWRVYEQELDWFRLREGEYIKLFPDDAGIICSEVFPGLWLAKSALLTGDLTTAIATLQKGLESLPHQDFIERLRD